MDNSIDQQFIEYVVKSLVGNPDAVTVERSVDEKGVLLELTVDPEDLGRVIGKRGATAQSLRTLLRALGTKNDARYNLKIIDNGDGGSHGEGTRQSDDRPAAQPAAKPDDNGDGVIDEPAGDTTVKSDEPIDIPEDTGSDTLSKTRQELAELDDLDI
jgi:predicted RNA-binding protein YlqC (UPF0109 family)